MTGGQAHAGQASLSDVVVEGARPDAEESGHFAGSQDVVVVHGGWLHGRHSSCVTQTTSRAGDYVPDSAGIGVQSYT